MEQLSKVFEEVRDEWTNSSGYDKDGKWDLHKTHIFTDEEARNLEDHVYDGIATESDVLDEALRRILGKDIRTSNYDEVYSKILGYYNYHEINCINVGKDFNRNDHHRCKVSFDDETIKAIQDIMRNRIEGYEDWGLDSWTGSFKFKGNEYVISAHKSMDESLYD